MAKLFGREYTRRELEGYTGRVEQLGGIRPIELSGGRERGVRGFDIDTGGGLRFTALADRALDISSASYHGHALAYSSPAGQAHPAFSSAMKYYGTELNKRRYEILMSAGGIDALEWESKRSGGGARPRAWLRTKANSIEGGTSEVMLGIVAKRILDLPGA